ncbi:mediator complex subunit med9 [Cystoisospora suis]|uniref:Mediator complex subunit med9 n=1 Tax=Cystoisospora suis TaxID=483139 RepID=A0A2C6KYT2_9APIC|nr:mediator complex subunit med9 [Cystoisospora suis]
MDIPELGDLCLNVEASKVSSTFSRIIDALRTLTEKHEKLSSQVASIGDRLNTTEDLRKRHTTVEEEHTRAIEQLREHTKELDALRLGDQNRKIQQHEEHFQKALALLEQYDLKLKEQDTKLTQMGIESRQSSSSLAKALSEFTDLKNLVEHSQDRIAKLIGASTECVQRCSQVEEDQKNLSESVASKYDKLWHEVVTALEKMNSTELSNFQLEVSKRSQQSELRVQQLVSYAIGLATRAARDRREADVKKAVISRWKERAWIGARQRMACRSLSRLFRIHLRRHFTRFEHVIAWETQVNRLKQEFSNSLPDVRSIVRDTVKVRIDALESRLTDEQSFIEQVKEEVRRLNTKAQEFQVATEELNDRSACASQALRELRADLDQEMEKDLYKEERLRKAEELVNDIAEKMSQVARQDEMQGIMKDVLLIWTAVKQLDAAKADKRELDAFANEASTRDQTSKLQLKNLESTSNDQHGRLRSQIGEMEAKLREVNTMSKTLNYMLGMMMRFMEDVVHKIASMDPNVVQYTRMANKVIRTGGGWIPPCTPCPCAPRPVSPAGRSTSPSSRPRCSPMARPSSRTKGLSCSPDMDLERSCAPSDITPLETVRSLGSLPALPAPKTTSENLEAILLPGPNTESNGEDAPQAAPEDRSGGPAPETNVNQPAFEARDTSEEDYANNPAVRAFTDWVEQVRVVFDAQAREAAVTGVSAESPGLGSIGSKRRDGPVEAVKGAPGTSRPRTAGGHRSGAARLVTSGSSGALMSPTMSVGVTGQRIIGESTSRSSSGGPAAYPAAFKVKRPVRSQRSGAAWGIFCP